MADIKNFKKIVGGIIILPSTAPATTTAGTLYYDTNIFKYSDGTVLREVGSKLTSLEVSLPDGSGTITADKLVSDIYDASDIKILDIATATLNGNLNGATATLSDRVKLTPQVSDPSPSDEGDIYYKTGSGLKVYDGSNWASVGSGSGEGEKNYITNSKAEDSAGASSSADWGSYVNSSALDSTAAEVPDNYGDRTSGSTDITIAANATTPLSGISDFKLTKANGNDNRGEGVSVDFDIDKADKAKKLIISFDYETDSAYADDDIKIFISSKKSGSEKLIRVNGEAIKAVSGTGKHYAQFQSESDSTEYRLIFHVASNSTSNYNINFDSVKVGPQKISHGTIITDWEDITTTANSDLIPAFTGSGDGTYSFYRKRRVGDSLEIQLRFNFSEAGTAESPAYFPLPDGLTARHTFYGNGDVETYHVSHSIPDTVQDAFVVSSCQASTSSNTLTIHDMGGSNALDEDAFSATAQVYISTLVPITGWSSNAKMSEDFSGRDVVGSFHLAADQRIETNSITKVQLETTVHDTTGSFVASTGADDTTGYYLIPETGFYDCIAKVEFDNWGSTPDTGIEGHDTVHAIITKNGITSDDRVAQGHERADPSSDTDVEHCFISNILHFAKGDKVYLCVKCNASDDFSVEATGDSLDTFLQIAKRQSAQTILENETVACKAFNSSNGQTFDFDPSTILILGNLFDSSRFDTHNAMTINGTTGADSGVTWADEKDNSDYYTVPITGFYQVNASIRVDGMEPENAAKLYLRNITKTQYESTSISQTTGTGSNYHDNANLIISTTIQADKGDQLCFGLQVMNADDAVTIQATLLTAEFSIAKIK
jgi:hypothetical protein